MTTQTDDLQTIEEAREELARAIIQYGVDSAQSPDGVLVGGGDIYAKIDAFTLAVVQALQRYRMQHHDDCASQRCECGEALVQPRHQPFTIAWSHAGRPQSCDCGLDALLKGGSA